MDPLTAASAPPVHTKQYVFVDEYNRHKRLKVMRACDGCRRRKIRCDGALQNGPWPCGACARLKLECVPPTLDPDDKPPSASPNGRSEFSFQSTISNTSAANTPDGVADPPPMAADWSGAVPVGVAAPTSAPIQSVTATGHPAQYAQQLGHSLDHASLSAYSANGFYPTPPAQVPHFQQPGLVRSPTEDSSGDPQEMGAAVRELSEHMGDLSIDITSAASYIANETKNLAETPAVEEADIVLPLSVTTDSAVRIPPEMMPPDERALDYFGYFFTYIHPYSPVLNRAAFYDQWRSARHSVSPLVLEGIFACVARYLEEPIEAQKWLALAARHEESFKDVPRLSTIQAMVLITRARESLPKRGYYYRSWMAVKYMTTMAFDLGLHEHVDQHRSGKSCKFSKADCLVRTRIWQTIFALEILIGAPQGRTDFAVELETVEASVPAPSPELDAFDHYTSRRFTYMAQTFRNVKVSNNLWQKTRRVRDDWALDPAFARQNERLQAWLKGLPRDFQLHYPDDGGPPFLGNDHFVAYVHIYHHLVVIMTHRPQLHTLLEKRDQGFAKHLDVLLDSAMQMCRLQEALIRDFGMHGLQFMLRGINFTIYCVLTCTMLHLAAITSPDPILNTNARTYFTRHMRVLESCIPGAGPDMVAQINALREAFSRDTSQPFELKPTLGLRSPPMENEPTPPDFRSSPISVAGQPVRTWAHLQNNQDAKIATPTSDFTSPYDVTAVTQGITNPPPAAFTSPNYQSSVTNSYTDQSLHGVSPITQTGYGPSPVSSHEQQPAWDPSGIFSHWNTAFGGAPAPPPVPPSTLSNGHPTSTPLVAQSPGSQHSGYTPQQQQIPPGGIISPSTIPVVPAVTPVMWQDAFTSAYVSGHGQKRYREASIDHSVYAPYSASKRRG
nr:cutinase transcription factor 1 alpha [Quercus suber]